MEGTFQTNLLGGPHAKAYIVWAAYSFSGKSLETKSVTQRRLDSLKAVRFGRYVSNELVWWTSCEGLHSLGQILVSSETLENQICDPTSARTSGGRQIWEVRFKRTCSLGFTRAFIVRAP